MDKLDMMSMNITEENVKKIQALFPNAVKEVKKDGKVTLAIDFDVLKKELGDSVMDEKQERYQMTWPDKSKAIRLANSRISATLRPCKEESVDFDNTQNLYIEGDNLDVLKLLRETYLGKVKMIYIDPPYNTGNDFVYEDDFAQDTKTYVCNSGQYDEQGNRLVQNKDSNGRFHTDWLNMIYPRLKLAKDLLTDDGILLISIDENEVENLKKICNEVFGEDNFLTCVTRATGTPTGGGFDGLVNELDYMLIYCKNSSVASINGLPMDEEDEKIYDQIDERGRYLIRPLRRTGGEDRREDRPTMFFPLKAPDGTEVYPIGPTGYDSRWICSSDTVNRMEANNLLEWKQTMRNGVLCWQVYQKFYLENRTKAPGNLWNDVEGNKKATRDIRNLFDSQKVFDFPKPIGFLKKGVRIASDANSIILDFFSGSATTAHAVMQLNAEDGGNRKYIMVQLPEECDEKSEAYKAGYRNICEIGKERIRRAGKKIKGEGGLTTQNLDIGFRVLKLDSTNMTDVFYNPSKVQQTLLDDSVDNIKPDRTAMDLLFQIMLDLGIELSAKIEEKTICGKTVYNVNENDIVACFDDDINNELITSIAKQEPVYAVFKSFAADSVGINCEQLFKTYSPSSRVKVI